MGISTYPGGGGREGGPERHVWEFVAHSPIGSLWNLHGLRIRDLIKRTWRSVIEDRLFGHAAELGFYFLFALFPTLCCAGSILGLAARSADQIYDRLLDYLALVIPTSALGTVLKTFNEIKAAASSDKLTFGTIAAIWSASVGISAIQDTLNAVYKIKESRSYFVARLSAIALTLLLTVVGSLTLAAMFAGDFVAALAYHHLHDHLLATAAGVIARVISWTIATALLALSFALIYYWAPDWKRRRWHWLTPGTGVGIFGWLLISLGLRIYLHFFNNYSVTYGSLGAVVILLTRFYITGLMLLLGAEINSEIEAAAAEEMIRRRQNAQSSARSEPTPHRGDLRSDIPA